MSESGEASFLDRGNIARVVERIHSLHSSWFALADRAHAIAMRAFPLILPPKTDDLRLVTAVLFARILTSFQSAYLLVERGLCADARTVVRAEVESTIILCALAVDRGVLDQLVTRELVNRRKLLTAWLDDPEAVAAMSPERKAVLGERLAEVRRMDPKLKGDPIDVRRLAESCQLLWLYNATFERLGSHIAASAGTPYQSPTATLRYWA